MQRRYPFGYFVYMYIYEYVWKWGEGERGETLRPFCRFYGTSHEDVASQLINLPLTATKYNLKHLENFLNKKLKDSIDLAVVKICAARQMASMLSGQ
jgi:hypothetical protein